MYMYMYIFTIDMYYCIQGNIRPCSPLSHSLSAGKVKTGRITMFQVISLQTQLRLYWQIQDEDREIICK